MIRNYIYTLAFLVASCAKAGSYSDVSLDYQDVSVDCSPLEVLACDFDSCRDETGLYTSKRIYSNGMSYFGCGVEYLIRPCEVNSSRDCFNCSSVRFEVDGVDYGFVREGQCLNLHNGHKMLLVNADSPDEVVVCFIGNN